MQIIINHTSMQPIYEQVASQIKSAVIQGTLKEQDPLPSVRTLSKELKISALTVKKAYDALEEEGFIQTIHGKGSFIAGTNPGLLKEERQKAIETEMEQIIRKGRVSGLSKDEIREVFELLMEDLNESF
ncbi:MAG: GntR family transcriptional regulator [Blautia sp.]|nr:GntR family transcriptional regulator [Blautia sp.]MDY5031805.1 GntR family transcriptional regulator [Blautia sp.]